MEMVENKGIIYSFGRFRLDPRERTLFVDGVAVHLPAKEFDTLLLLVENNGHALSKDEMMSAIWQDATVEEGNLSKQIYRLRKLLNENGNEFIETIPKHGYRFSADLYVMESGATAPLILEKRTVKRVTLDYQDDESEKLLLPATRSSTRRTFFAVGGSLLALLLVGAIYFFVVDDAQPSASASAPRSLAVLPFKAVAADDGDENLRLGLTDALITKLANLKKIVVRPTNAVRRYDQEIDPREAGRKLEVDVVLDGNVQRVDQQIRVTVQLVSVRDGTVLWGGKFDEKFTDIFSVQDAISEQVARQLEPGLTGEEKILLAKRYTTNADAHHAYVRGRLLWNRRTANDLKAAIKSFEEAIAKDPNYALAYAGLADAYSLLSDYAGALPDEAYPKAKETAIKALELDDGLAEAHTALAYVNMYYYWDWAAAENEYRRAVSLNPNYASAHQWYAEYLTAMGRFDEALSQTRRAKEIDPLSPIINAGEVWTLYFARRYDEAIERGKSIAETNPQFAEIHEYLKRCYDQKGMYAEAIAARQLRRKLVGADGSETAILKQAAAAKNAKDYWKSRLEQELVEARTEGHALFNMAEIYAQLGEKDLAFTWLEKAIDKRHYEVMYLRAAPNLDPLRTDPRFGALVNRVRLTIEN